MTPETHPSFSFLRGRYLAGQLVIFAGAGVSRAAGLPTWTGLAQQLISDAAATSTDPHVADAIQQARKRLAGNDLIGALTEIAEGLPPPVFVRLVKAALDDRGHDVPELARTIAALPRLHGVVTTNLDRLFERAFAGNLDTFHGDNLPLNLGQDRPFILKAHGTIEIPDSWVLTKNSYESRIHARPALQQFIRSLYLQRTFLFVGYGMRDPDLELMLGWMRTFAGNQPPRHVALMAEDSLDRGDRRDLGRAGIEVLFYNTPGGSHAEAAHLLRALDDPTSLSSTSSAPFVPTSPTPTPSTSSPSAAAARRQGLIKLFATMYSSSGDLQRLASYIDDDLRRDLPDRVSFNETSLALATALIDRSLVPAALDQVAAERPRRTHEIDELRPLFPSV